MSIVEKMETQRKAASENQGQIPQKELDLPAARHGELIVTPANGSLAETQGTDVTPDQELLTMLNRVKRGWSPSQVTEFVDEYVKQLYLFADKLGIVGVMGLIGRLHEQLTKHKLSPPSKKQLQSMLVVTAANLGGVEQAMQFKDNRKSSSPKNSQFVLVGPETEGQSENPDNWGIMDRETGELLTNVSIVFERQTSVEDEFDTTVRFMGKLSIYGEVKPFEITSSQLASDYDFRNAILSAAGPEAQLPNSMTLLRNAVAMISKGKVKNERRITSQGWNEDGTLYRVQSGVISRDGYRAYEDSGETVIDLTTEELARNLDLQPAAGAAELAVLRRHVVDDLMQVHDRTVTYPMMGALGAALLHRFVGDVNRVAIWLRGLTGSGKSFLGQLFMNFFGRFRPSSGGIATWGATGNYIQKQGYFFKDAMYLVDDYKPDLVHATQVLRILQAYADGTGRGRLKSDATTNTTRPIRGLLVSTGEDIPQHSASSLARSIIIEVPQMKKDLARGQRCLTTSESYTGVTVDILRWFLAEQRAEPLRQRFEQLQRYFYQGIAGKQNDIRIASNLALIGTGFVEMARYFGDIWKDWKKVCYHFITEELLELRNQMVDHTHEQQPSEVFIRTLRELINHGRVLIMGFHTPSGSNPTARCIGKVGCKMMTGSILNISLELAIEEVQESLRRQGRPALAVTAEALEKQLLDDGMLLDRDGHPFAPGIRVAKKESRERVRVEKVRYRCIRVKDDILREESPPPRPRVGLKTCGSQMTQPDSSVMPESWI